MTKFSVPVVEYSSAKRWHTLKTPLQPFVLDDQQLVVSMVRSILTTHSGKASRKYLAAIVKPTLRFMLDWSRAPHLCIATSFVNMLRDFSATTRVGELAQGVSYAFWKLDRGYSCIADFGPWASALVPPYSGKKSPDFVMLNPITNDVAIMESKGTGTDCPKSSMNRALAQCEAVLKKVGVSRGFGSVLVLDSNNRSTGVGTLHICDPENRIEITDEMKHYLFRRSYASWFDLSGDDERLLICQQSVPKMHFVSESFKSDEIHNEYESNLLKDITTTALGFDPTRTEYKIDSEIEAALTDIKAYKRINWRQLSERIKLQSKSEQGQIRFPDGTSIFESRA